MFIIKEIQQIFTIMSFEDLLTDIKRFIDVTKNEEENQKFKRLYCFLEHVGENDLSVVSKGNTPSTFLSFFNVSLSNSQERA